MDIYKKSTIILALIVFLIGGYIFADNNGIWHLAKDVRPGVFGEDEARGNFIFIDRVGIKNHNPSYNLDVNGSVNGLTLYMNNELVSTKGYVDTQITNTKNYADGEIQLVYDYVDSKNIFEFNEDGGVGIGSDNPSAELDVNGTIKADSICLGDDCISGWPTQDDGVPTGYTELYWNFGEDVYGASSGGGAWSRPASETCSSVRGEETTPYICKPTETKSCVDAYENSYDCGGNEPRTCTDYYSRNVICKAVTFLVKDNSNIQTATATATITARDYSGSSEKCWVSYRSSTCNWDKRSPSSGHWDDALCKQWVEEGLKYYNFCSIPQNIIDARWALSGSSGTVTISYSP